jgi:hypothetical protein
MLIPKKAQFTDFLGRQKQSLKRVGSFKQVLLSSHLMLEIHPFSSSDLYQT